MKTIDFSKSADGLIPAIIQDATTKTVLMLGLPESRGYRYHNRFLYLLD